MFSTSTCRARLDTYLHRIGRTGRAGKKGVAISLVEAHDHLLLGKIGRYIDERSKRALLMNCARQPVHREREADR